MPAPAVPKDDDPATPIPALDSFPSTGVPLHAKKAGYAFYEGLGSPRNVVAPMVDQSELAWRVLSRRYNSHLIYTPMINARQFTSKVQSKGPAQLAEFWISDKEKQEEGQARIEGLGSDRPLVVQFAGHDPETLLAAARVVQDHCDAVDLNLGCPQDIARRGRYGSFLQSDWQLIFRLINTLHVNLRIPVTAKMRVFESTERTVAYARMMERAGAQMITVHGRTREMKGHKTGMADWKKIKAVKEAVGVPVLANGNILYRQDVESALHSTGADAVMSAEGNLYNPAIFATPPSEPTELYPLVPAYPFPRLVSLIAEYLDICDRLETPTRASAIKAHLFRLARPALEIHRDLRPLLGKCSVDTTAQGRARHEPFHLFLSRLRSLLAVDEGDARYASQLSSEPAQFVGKEGEEPVYIPHWLAQPYYRKTLPPVDESKEAKEERREKRKERVEQTEGLVHIDDVQTSGEGALEAGARADKRLRVLLDEAQVIKEKANGLFSKSDYDAAIVEYTEALGVLPARRMQSGSSDGDATESQDEPDREVKDGAASSLEEEGDDEEDEEKVRMLRAVIYSNLAACHLKKQAFKEAVMACNESLLDDPLYLKSLNRRAQANEEIGTWSSLTSSLEDYKAMNAMPHPISLQPSLDAALARIPPKLATTSEREKEEMMGKLKGIGDSVLGYFGLSTDNFQLKQGEGGGYNLNFVR